MLTLKLLRASIIKFKRRIKDEVGACISDHCDWVKKKMCQMEVFVFGDNVTSVNINFSGYNIYENRATWPG